MAYSVKNSLFIRNLSPNVTEGVLREVFGTCDEIEGVVFRAFPNQNNQFFAQVDFKTSKGVVQGNKLNGTPILGVACLVGVIDPLNAKVQQDLEVAKIKQKGPDAVAGSAVGTAASVYGEGQDKPQGVQAEYFKQQKEAMTDQQFRTVHMSGFKTGVTSEALRAFCEHFGEVEVCRVEEPKDAEPFALVEFKERGAAHVVKTQKSYEVDGRIITFSDSKTMVDAVAFAEKSVHFQQPIFDFMNMKAVLAQQGHLTQKLAQVREAALSLKMHEKTPQLHPGLASAPAPAANEDSVKDDSPKRKRSRSGQSKKKRKKESKEDTSEVEKADKEKKQKKEKDVTRTREGSRSRSLGRPRTRSEELRRAALDRVLGRKRAEVDDSKRESSKKAETTRRAEVDDSKRESSKKAETRRAEVDDSKRESSKRAEVTAEESTRKAEKKAKKAKKKDVASEDHEHAPEKQSPEKAAKKEKKKKKDKKEKKKAEDDDDAAAAEKESAKKLAKKKKKEKKDKDEKKKDDASEDLPDKVVKKKKKPKMALEMEEDAKDAEDQPEKAKKKKKPKMALETEDGEQETEETGRAAGAEAGDDNSDESSSAPIDLDDPDGVDMVPNTMKVALSSASSSSSSSSSTPNIDEHGLEITGIDHGLELLEWTRELELIEKVGAVNLNDRSDAVEFVKTLPMGSPALTTPGDISSTDSDSSSSDSPVREIAGEISDGDDRKPGAQRRRKPRLPIPRAIKPRIRMAPAKVTIGLDEAAVTIGLEESAVTIGLEESAVTIGLEESAVTIGAVTIGLDEVRDGGAVASDDDVVLD